MIYYTGHVEGEIDADPKDPDAWAEAISELWAELAPHAHLEQPEAEMQHHDPEEEAKESWAEGYEAGQESGEECCCND